MNQSKKAVIQKNLKPILAKYGVKGSLRVRNGHAITLTLRSGSVDFVGDMNEYVHGREVNKNELRKHYNFMINQYWFTEHYDGTALQFIDEVNKAMKSADWYDRSDIQTDYFDTAYYYDICVGEWNAPYTVTK
jgi:hypothetical protein